MFDFSKIGMKPAYSTEYFPAVTAEQILEIEKHCGHTLPENYNFMLKNYHGGCPEAKEFDAYDNEIGILFTYELCNFNIVDEKRECPLNIWWVINQSSELIGPETLPFADDGYGRIYYMKWINNIPQVWVLAYRSEQEPDSYFLLNSFDELLESLFIGD